ncbi:MAG: winged helix-turn-helix domain-containing protein [Caldilineaceae bacterium]|nr:winged helix-turn-helix domain-containing protein [Caldilineaceae bacterium]
MPRTLRLQDGSYMRHLDVHNLLQYLYNGQCVQVVGFSNVGKSALLRLLAQPDVWTQELGEAGQEFLAVYVDCNRMLEMSDQGFYELVLRCLQEASPTLAALPELRSAYEMLVTPASEFQVPLGFTRGVTAVLQATQQSVIFLLDEFDEPFTQLDSRVFLNLRALRDRHSAQLTYVTATNQPLTVPPSTPHVAEFCELFAPRTWFLAPLTRLDVERSVRAFMDAYEADFTPADVDFIFQWAGGHPNLVESVCIHLDAALDHARGLRPSEHWELHQNVARQLLNDERIKQECAKLWDGCTPEEQAELIALCRTPQQPTNQHVLANLVRRHLVLRVEGHYLIFCRLLQEFVRRKTVAQPAVPTRLWVNVESGDVLVDNKPVETLTSLEYKLMLLLFYNVDKIVDRYQLVTDVWGEEYLDEVEDARIEKLISRLRQKIEPDPSNPRFLMTIRSRGYRLQLGQVDE